MPAEKRKVTAGPTAKKWYKAKSGAKAKPPAQKPTRSVKRRSARPSVTNKKIQISYSGYNIHNALLYSKRVLHVPGAYGEFVPVPIIWRDTALTYDNRKYWYIIFATASDLLGLQVWGDTFAANPLLSSTLFNSDPVALRPLRLSVSIRNTTKNDEVGGSIKVLNTPQHLPLEFQTGFDSHRVTPACAAGIANAMETSPAVKCYTAKSLQQTHGVHAPPASAQEFKTFQDFIHFDVTDTTTRQASNAAVIDRAQHRMVSNMIVIEMTSTTTQNSYELAVHRQDACRFHHENILSQMAVAPQAGNQQGFDQSVHAAQASAASAPLQIVRPDMNM